MECTTPQKSDIPGLRKLFLASKPMLFKKGTTVQSSENARYINFVASGFIKRYMITNGGTESVQVIYGSDHIFSLTLIFNALFGQELYDGSETHYYEAMCPSIIHTLGIDTLIREVEADPLLYKELLAVAGHRLHSNIQRIENIALKSAYKRVAHQLLYFGKQFGVASESGIAIQVPLTHQDIASLLDTARETVSLCIASLRENGLIETNSSITILDMVKLEKEAYS